jgi:quercetin dioxygenase-like cupin family protein
VERWDLLEIPTPNGRRDPVVLSSDDEARVVLIGLNPGQRLGEHQVKENTYLAVIDGSVQVETAGESFEFRAGTLFTFAPDERRSVSTESGARLLLLFAPWPGDGHYRAEEKAATA